MSSDKFPTLAELRAQSTDDLMRLRTDTVDTIGELEASVAFAEHDQRGVDAAWATRVATKKSALQHGLKNLKNVLTERGVGIPAAGSALPGFDIAQSYVNHALRLLRSTAEVVDAARAFVEAAGPDEGGPSYARMVDALAELEARQSQWITEPAATR